ncbi:DUF3152 domain-containing protein [Nonomuraea sp. NPDC000554]|uniref:DUF3152 domain-containing protein n=1 Tax=Nonomuraea sp. NPDC000554 TaxID=3154259 RepID=UPI0033280946
MRPSVVLVSLLVTAGCGVARGPVPSPPSPTPSATSPPPSAAPAGHPPSGAARKPEHVVAVPYAASGEYEVVPGDAPARPGGGEVVRYLVEVERGLPFDGQRFAAAVHRALNDPRGWARFERVDHDPVWVRVALSSPSLTNQQCRPLNTGDELSCWNGTRSIINARRWAKGVPGYGHDLAGYRDYVVNHEVGHSLGHEHTVCPGPGQPAPVMVQQSKSLGGCLPNPWPFPSQGQERSETEDRPQ